MDNQVDSVINLVENNPFIAKYICNLCLNEQMASNVMSQSEIEKLAQDTFYDYELAGLITQEEYDVFYNEWKMFDTHQKGNLLENLIRLMGAYVLNGDDVQYVLDSKIYHSKITSNHNFDVIFYHHNNAVYDNDNKKIQYSAIAEYHECKNDICKWLPCDMREFFSLPRYKEAKKKLLFIKKVHKIVNDKGYFYIPTLAFNVSGRQSCLDRNGFDFIKILGISDILEYNMY